MTAADLVEQLVSVQPRGRPMVVAVDGASAAGTTTLAVEVGRRLAASVVSGDDFYRDMTAEQRWRLSAAEGVELYLYWQRLRREVLEPLQAGRPVPAVRLAGRCRPGRAVDRARPDPGKPRHSARPVVLPPALTKSKSTSVLRSTPRAVAYRAGTPTEGATAGATS